MTGGNALPVAAVFVGVLALGLAFAWFLARRDWDPPGALESARDAPPSESESPSAPDSASDPDSDAATSGPEFGLPGDPNPTQDAAGGVPDGDPPPLDADGETVFCRHCGAENRPDFRYCRWCVRSGFAADGPGPPGDSSMADRSL